MSQVSGANLYKRACQDLLMGAREAIRVLNLLYGHGALDGRTVREYVVRALCAGTDLRLDTPEYVALEDSIYRDIIENEGRNTNAVSLEGADYLRRVLASATGDRFCLSPAFTPYDGFSKLAYDEVYDLLGRAGRRYLAISGPRRSLAPDPRRVRVLVEDEREADLEEYRGQEARSNGPQDPTEIWNAPNPMLEPFPDLRERESWNLYWPELEPFPDARRAAEMAQKS